MLATNEKLLYETYDTLIKVAMGEWPLVRIEKLLSKQFMGYGSARDEEIYGFDGFKWMLERQWKEIDNSKSKYNRIPKFKQFYCNGNAVLIVEELEIIVTVDNDVNKILLRLSTILEYISNEWFILHFHGSTPDANTEEGDAWPIEEWKRRNKELEIRVLQKTADLIIKNRELEIEAALERVRSKTMAMQRSEELDSVIKTVYSELKHLDVSFERCFIMIFDEHKGATWWMGSADDDLFHEGFYVQYHTHPPHLAYLKGWEERQQKWQYLLEGQIKKDWDEFIFNKTELSKLPPIVIQYMKSFESAHLAASFENFGCMTTGGAERLSEESISIISRFAKVFDQTYTRFNDLKLAEEQAREAQIEASLERVRGRTMAMHNSEEVMDVAGTLFEEQQKLDFTFGASSIIIMDKESGDAEYWIAGFNQNRFPESYKVKYFQHPYHDALLSAWKDDQKYLEYKLEGEEKKAYDEVIFSETEYRKIPEEQKKLMRNIGSVTFSIAFIKHGALHWGPSPLNEEKANVLQRFALVFEQAYTRFLDLQKAEAQAREAQIEAALERVRAAAMAMHKSDDLHAAVTIMFEEFQKLNLNVLRCGVGILNKDSRTGTVWATSVSDNGLAFQISANESFDIHPLMMLIYEYWQKQEDLSYVLQGQDLINYYRAMDASELKLPKSQLLFSEDELQPQYYYAAMFSTGGLYAFRDKPYTAEDLRIMKRFASVVNLTYNRFLDLQKAETQAREAQIETSLERVRSRSMAMHSSEGLLSVTQVLREQMALLGEKKLESILIHIYNKETDDFEAWYSFRNPEDPNGKIIDGKVILEWSNTARARMDKEQYHSDETDYTIVANREILTEWYKYLEKVVPEVVEYDSIGNILVPDVLYYNYSKFPGGALLLITNSEASESSKNLLKRSANVFNLAYTRFIDLRKAEAQAKEAMKQASLDRVRGEIASMRSTADLDKITPLIWNELTTLGIQFSRCGVFIMDEELEQINTHLSTPDGKAIAAFHLPYNTQGIIKQILEHWYKKDIYREYWDEAAFNEWIKNLLKQGAITSTDNYNKENRPTNLYLHFFPFLQGMLYVGSESPLGEEGILVVKTLAGAFSSAYARYEDFNKLEIAKQQVDETLIELKATQKQLIQSEKMASLGELTAGIAHEIQNPLNFVNNFSEVNKELLVEMKDEINKGNINEVTTIANDVIENEEKINHHGKRADAIVKGMLLHSRSSSGIKEPTDINKLVDEYLRLAYHGLRAKDKSFNSTMNTEFDESIGNINIIPQDIGRVVLNLINNAFYAVSEKKTLRQAQGDTYEPNVSVSTKLKGTNVLISVEDNGNGIPQKVLDKIFQPFFTTKPTGEGTGLGLSLSYDIIKVHGGELRVETKEREGSEFIIQLPKL